MNKTQKLEYQQELEKYLENKQIYDMFEHLMKSLIKERPENPLEFMISKLENTERIFV